MQGVLILCSLCLVPLVQPQAINVTLITRTTTTAATTPRPCRDGTYGPNCASCGHCQGICNKTTGVCPSCLPGYDFSKDQKCTIACDNGKYGAECTGTCSPHCNPSNMCNRVNGSCSTCHPGWKGDLCNQECEDGKYGLRCASTCGHCTGTSVCNKVSGQCPASCLPGYAPTDSTCQTVCNNGKYGQDCLQDCSNNCIGLSVCNASDGTCSACKPGFYTSTCKQACPDGKWGDCTSSCSANCEVGEICAKSNGHCPCKPGYQTPTCVNVCNAGTYGQNCAETCGHCSAGSQPCNRQTGVCARCVDNRELPLCKVCVAGQWGPTCGQRCGQCGGEGRCDEVNGTCLTSDCLDGWSGAMCNMKCPIGWYGRDCKNLCGHCKGNTCRHDNGVCEQDCEDDYIGVLCTTEKESLVAPIVGSVMGAAVLIVIVIIVVAIIYMKRAKKPEPPKRDFSDINHTESLRSQHGGERDSTLYQNISGPRVNPAYDRTEFHQRDEHSYAQHAPDRANHTYRNTGAAGVTGAPESTYGNVGPSNNTYGNVNSERQENPYGNV